MGKEKRGKKWRNEMIFFALIFFIIIGDIQEYKTSTRQEETAIINIITSKMLIKPV
jgi:hypothetical protein